MSAAISVVDLGFGDAGKGRTIDALARSTGARAVVRFNGGAQAGHNVVTRDGRHHTFSQFGAASFLPGALTILSRHVVFHPTALLVEARVLESKGVNAPLARILVSPDAIVTTPYHQTRNQLRERARGEARHGSCGVGVGDTVEDSLEHEPIRVKDLGDRTVLARKLAQVRERLRASLVNTEKMDRALDDTFEDDSVFTHWLDRVIALHRQLPRWGSDPLRLLLRGSSSTAPVLFEGAQGVLLDEWRGFHPHTTWSTCTFENVDSLLAESGFRGEHKRIGVTRTYSVRHGAGPFPTESSELALQDRHNTNGVWQGAFRVGHLDTVLLRYAVDVIGKLDGIALTHCDAVTAHPLHAAASYFVHATHMTHLPLGPHRDLKYQEGLTEMLFAARPCLVSLGQGAEALDAVTSLVASTCKAPICMRSFGPRSDEAFFLGAESSRDSKSAHLPAARSAT